MEKLPITLCVITRNSEGAIGPMLKKHRDFIKEILVVDQDSTDNTRAEAEEVADMVFTRKAKGTADPDRNWLFSIAQNPWVLYLDDDEYLDEELIKILPELLDDGIDIYWLKTRKLVDGVDIKEILGEDPHPRLFKKGAVTYQDQQTNLDHTFPEAHPQAMVAYINHYMVHDRTLDKVIKSNRRRNAIATPEQTRMQEGFIKSVQDYLEKKKWEIA